MATIIEGNLSAASCRFALVVSRFNDFVTHRLRDGALDCLHQHGVADNAIDIIFCPGAFEIPATAQLLSSSSKYDAIICLGCIIRGATPHFDYVASAVSTGIARIALASPIPIIFGVLTTNTLEQAIERAGSKSGNKGWDAALAAIEMVNLYKKISVQSKK